jgi:hypothetical protein
MTPLDNLTHVLSELPKEMAAGKPEDLLIARLSGITSETFKSLSASEKEVLSHQLFELEKTPEFKERFPALFETVAKIHDLIEDSEFVIPPLPQKPPSPPMGKAWAVYKTVKSFFKTSLEFTPDSDPVLAAGQARIATMGKQLASSDVINFVEKLQLDAELFSSFFAMKGFGVNLQTLDSLKETLSFLPKTNPQKALILPVTFEGESLWETGHIALILIKEGNVEYYDSKGILSKDRPLKDEGKTLHDFLIHCRDTYAPGGVIYENPYQNQVDAHNCGVFVCKQIYSRLVDNTPLGSFENRVIHPTEMGEFRKKMLALGYNVSPPNTPPPASLSSSDDF